MAQRLVVGFRSERAPARGRRGGQPDWAQLASVSRSFQGIPGPSAL